MSLLGITLAKHGAALGIGKVARRVVERSVGHVLAALARDLTGMRARRGLGLRQLSWFEVVRTVGSKRAERCGIRRTYAGH